MEGANASPVPDEVLVESVENQAPNTCGSG